MIRWLVVAVALACSAGCGDGALDPGVDPLAPVARAEDDPTDGSFDSDPAASADPTDSGAPDGPHDSDDAPPVAGVSPPDDDRSADRARAAVTQVLAAYGQVLSQMSSDPAGAPPPGSPLRGRWDELVVAGSVLSEELLDRTSRRALQDRMVIEPDESGASFLHRPVELLSVAPDEVSFTWCGWSPGIGRSVDTGQVMDDAVGHATGTGRIVTRNGGWRLAALDQEQLTLLAPGSADPCIIAEVPR